jgi:hypothetical protein
MSYIGSPNLQIMVNQEWPNTNHYDWKNPSEDRIIQRSSLENR